MRNNALERVLALTITLRSGRFTAKQLATRHAVTTRTIRRDIDSLLNVGVPVVRGGDVGEYALWWIADGWTL